MPIITKKREGFVTQGESGARRRRVLVVDDNEDSARTLAEVLNIMGHEAHFLTHPLLVLKRALEFRPDVMLLDIGMPELNGYDLARLLRKHFGRESLRLVAITGYGTPQDRKKSSEAGFDAHLTKPADVAMLQHMMELLFDPKLGR
jgi:CheY-like chemotaxis protein